MNSISALLAREFEDRPTFDDELPEPPVCWSLDDFADIVEGAR